MTHIKNPTTEIHAVQGVRVAACEAGIRKQGRKDLALVELAKGTTVAAVFTRNAFVAAPVTVAKEHLQQPSRYLLINSGCANTGLGDAGVQIAFDCCDALAEVTGVPASAVLPFSTGVIGEPLPIDKITACLPKLYADLASDQWGDVAAAIMTTDTVVKHASKQLQLKQSSVSITGVAKGSGMIHPDMATMLAFVTTDLAIDQSLLQDILNTACDDSFNSITVDGDTSTNDSCILAATGQSGVQWQDLSQQEQMLALDALYDVLQSLAKQIARDGEGATKFITIHVSEAPSKEAARAVGRTIATSPLVKTACYAEDPNWGRIVAALGRSPVKGLDISKVRCAIGGHGIFIDGAVHPDYDEATAKQAMTNFEITISIALGMGDAQSTVWTSDLSQEYITINAEYRT